MNARTCWGIIIAASLAVSGCGQNTEGGPQTASGDKQMVVGFSQIGAESGWRQANTDSIRSEAKNRGIKLMFSDAQQKQENQFKALRSFITQKVDVIMFSPIIESGWEPVMKEIKDAGIPVIVADRRPDVDPSMYVTFIGSDFVEEGRRAGEWLAKEMGGKARIAELQGTVGSAPALDRAKGFREVLKKYPGMEIVISQSGNFTRTEGKVAMEAFLKNPRGRSANALFAHNDDMGIGAIQAIEEAGIKPGKDIIIVSIDGVKDAFRAMVDGKLNCTVECNPLIGPQLFDAVEAIVAKKELPKRIEVKEGVYDQKIARSVIDSRKY